MLIIRLIVLNLLVTACTYGQVLYAQDEALERAFGEAVRSERKSIVITPTKADELTKKFKFRYSAGVISYYEGYDQNDQLIGYAFIDSGTVRTHLAMFMVVFSPEGVLKDVFVLSFGEPAEYLPSKKWLKTFEGLKIDEVPMVSKNIPTVMGSTLTVNAITASVGRVQGLFSEFLRK
jgi:hypothetical protein